MKGEGVSERLAGVLPMPDRCTDRYDIALLGGGDFCREVLETYVPLARENEFSARIVAVADPQPESPGIILAKELGLITARDYRQLYDPQYDIRALVLLTPEDSLLQDVLKTKPPRIRLVSYQVFRLLWTAIATEHQKLQRRNQEAQTILNSIQDFIMVITPDREIMEVNQPLLDKMGYTREEVIGRKCYEVFQKFYSECTLVNIQCPLNEAVETRAPSQQVLRQKDFDGGQHDIEVKIFPVFEKGWKISKFIEVSRDISAMRREEEEITRRLEKMVEDRASELKETHAKLLHQDKMASLGKLAASVVHEINNPISGILNLVMLMNRILEEGPLQEKELAQFSQYLKLMENETRRISRIVSNLLAFSRHSKMEFGILNLNQLIEKTLFLNANLLKLHSIKLEQKFDPHLPELMGSEDRLQQVFMNLISNAVEALESCQGDRILMIETEYLPKNGSITISFRDTGVGIPAENLPKLFEPFFSTKKKGKGVGLGLSVAYGIVQEHGGSIRVQSEVGKWTNFGIELPLKTNSKVFSK
jgi:two-component system, NtrC family, sensor kinase